jgi:hypothetical protein
MNAASPKSSTPLQMEAQPQQGGNTPIKVQKTRLGVAPTLENKVDGNPRKQAAKTLGDMHNLYRYVCIFEYAWTRFPWNNDTTFAEQSCMHAVMKVRKTRT